MTQRQARCKAAAAGDKINILDALLNMCASLTLVDRSIRHTSLRTPPRVCAMCICAVGVEVTKISRSKSGPYPPHPCRYIAQGSRFLCRLSPSPPAVPRSSAVNGDEIVMPNPCLVYWCKSLQFTDIKIHPIETVPLSLPICHRPPLVLRTTHTTAMGPNLKKSKPYTGKVMEGRSSISSYFTKVDTAVPAVVCKYHRRRTSITTRFNPL